MSFNHEKLDVYQRTLTFNARISDWIVDWDNKHSIHDHLPRAAGSILENIAMGSAAFSRMKVRSLDFALGSILECAACLDIASLKHLLDPSLVVSEKDELSQLLKMVIGLRRSWSNDRVKEGGADYGKKAGSDGVHNIDGAGVLFHHERLDVYMVALQAMTEFCASESVQALNTSVFGRLDVLTTSMILRSSCQE